MAHLEVTNIIIQNISGAVSFVYIALNCNQLTWKSIFSFRSCLTNQQNSLLNLIIEEYQHSSGLGF